MQNLYDPEAAGNILGVSPVTLHHWRKAGVGPEWFKRGRYYYYRADKLQEYLDRTGPLPTTEAEKRRFFTDAHRPDVIPETPEPATVAELSARLVVVEVELAKLKSRKRARQRAGLTI